MAITYSLHTKDNVLHVKASGYDESLEEVQKYSLDVLKTAIDQKCCAILSDERHLEYRISVTDTFALAEILAQAAPRVGRAAIVCSPTADSCVGFFEDTTRNRGLQLRMFHDYDNASHWIEEYRQSFENQKTE